MDEGNTTQQVVTLITKEGIYNDHLALFIANVKNYAIFMLDPGGYVMSWNSGAELIKGYRADEIIGSHFSRFYSPEDQAAGVPERALAVAKAEGRFEAEGWRVRKDGSHFWASVVITALHELDGTLYGFGKVTRDMTEQVVAQSKLAASEQRFQLLVDGVKDYAIFMLDPGGYVMSWNGGAELIKGYRADEIIGSHFSRFYSPEDQAAGVPELALAVAKAEGRFEAEGWRVRKDGSHFWASVVITTLYNEQGLFRGFAKVTRDLTEHKRGEETRIALLKEQAARTAAEANVQLRDEFINVASHELKTPVTVILGHLQLLYRRLFRKSIEQDQELLSLQAIIGQVMRLNRLIHSLLDLSYLQDKQLKLSLELLDFCLVVEQILDEFRSSSNRVNTLVYQLPSEPCYIMADRMRLEQVLQNLIQNAIKYSPGGSPITVVIDQFASTISCSITDTGIGIPAEDIPRLGTRFFRARNAQSSRTGGMGIGLYIVKQIIILHGGDFKISSQENCGTTVTFSLPQAIP